MKTKSAVSSSNGKFLSSACISLNLILICHYVHALYTGLAYKYFCSTFSLIQYITISYTSNNEFPKTLYTRTMKFHRTIQRNNTKKVTKMDVLIGKKGAMAYVLAVVTGFNSDNKVVIKARGRNISKAVDVAEIIRNRFLQEAKIDKIEIGTETIENRAVSTMEITMSK